MSDQTKVIWWRNPVVRSYIFQALLMSVIVIGVWNIWDNTIINMESRGMRTGFDFLGLEAGFPILYSPFIDYNPSINTYFDTFLIGLFNTILVSVLGIIATTILGLFVGIARLSKNFLLSKIASIYIEIFRNIPLLLQILFWYLFCTQLLPPVKESWQSFDALFLNVKGLFIPEPIFASGSSSLLIAAIAACVVMWFVRKWAKKRHDETGKRFPVFFSSIGILVVFVLAAYWLSGSPVSFEVPQQTRFSFKDGIQLIPELVALWFALTIYTAAFIAENVRAGIQAVPYGQTEAAQSLGLKNGLTLRLIILPQALKVIIPPTISQYLNLAKNSSLAAAIGYPDVVAVFAGTALNQSGRAVEIMVMTMVVYWTMSFSISFLMNVYNKRSMMVER